VDGSGSGTFVSSITGLSPSTLYYVRAYATNSNRTDYGSQINFTTLPPTGLTSASAATSAKAIKDAYPSSTDGAYWIQNANINSGTPFQIYADMTTNGGGWMLLNLSGGGVASTEISSITALSDFGYLPRTTVIALANVSTEVRLTSGPLSNKMTHITISNNSNPITALRSSSTAANGPGTWYSSNTSFTQPSGYSAWTWSQKDSPITGWPNMFHSSGVGTGVHWLYTSASASGKDFNSGNYYSTWIR
jgi:hypothetical protein